mmetsp:Transcript_76185/g.176741  ORF Transcript_76185/g.176741 Transcript_76185/m.176741 type:complete len:240 (-) Transcript_76185:505-1224(-)
MEHLRPCPGLLLFVRSHRASRFWVEASCGPLLRALGAHFEVGEGPAHSPHAPPHHRAALAHELRFGIHHVLVLESRGVALCPLHICPHLCSGRGQSHTGGWGDGTRRIDRRVFWSRVQGDAVALHGSNRWQRLGCLLRSHCPNGKKERYPFPHVYAFHPDCRAERGHRNFRRKCDEVCGTRSRGHSTGQATEGQVRGRAPDEALLPNGHGLQRQHLPGGVPQGLHDEEGGEVHLVRARP